MTAWLHTAYCRQRGQALTEAMVVLGALTGLLWAVYASGTWQDDSLRAGLAARQAAFAYNRLDADVPPDFSVYANDDWADSRIRFAAALPEGLPNNAQPGGSHAHAATLRRDWRVAQPVVMAAYVEVATSHRERMAAVLGDVQTLTRHTVVLRGAGHAGADAQAHARIAASDLAWQRPAQATRAVGQALAVRMQPVEQAWLRPAPDFDWLQKWTDLVPPQALRTGSREEVQP